MFSSPAAGFTIDLVVMGAIYALLRSWRPVNVNHVFGKLQLISAVYMGFSHEFKDAQKTVRIITMGLIATKTSGAFAEPPGWLSVLKAEDNKPTVWVKVVCTISVLQVPPLGGIIKTLGQKMLKLQPVRGFAPESSPGTLGRCPTGFSGHS